MKIIDFLKKYYFIILFFFIVGILSLASSPIFHPVPHTDSGIFLYIGKQILSGEVPYRDLWDHKGPIIFLINSIGVLLDSNSLWGIWVVESVFLFFASLASYKFFEEVFGKLVAFLSTSFWLTFFVMIRSLNFSENYYILVQFLIIILFLKAEKSENRRKLDFGIGVISAIGFLIRPNMIGIALAVGLVWLWNLWENKKVNVFLQKLLYAILGALSIFGILFIYLILNNALPDFIDQVFLFNFYYSGDTQASFLSFIEFGNNNIDFILPFAFAGWLTVLLGVISNVGNQSKIRKKILILFLLCLPIEIFLSALSGYKYLHYFVTWFVPIALVVSYLFSLIYDNLPKTELLKTKITFRQAILTVMFIGFISFTLIEHYAYAKSTAYWCLKKQHLCTTHYDEETIEILDYLESNTSSDEIVYFWALELRYNFLGDRKSMGKFWNSRVFNNVNYLENGIIDQFKKEILSNKPIIIDTSPQYDYIIPLFSGASGLEGADQIQKFLKEYYIETGKFDLNGWIIYEFQDGQYK